MYTRRAPGTIISLLIDRVRARRLSKWWIIEQPHLGLMRKIIWNANYSIPHVLRNADGDRIESKTPAIRISRILKPFVTYWGYYHDKTKLVPQYSFYSRYHHNWLDFFTQILVAHCYASSYCFPRVSMQIICSCISSCGASTV